MKFIDRIAHDLAERVSVIAALLLLANAVPMHAQGSSQKITKAAQSIASFAADLALTNGKKTNVDDLGLPTVSIDGITVSVSEVTVKRGVAVRLLLAYHNPGDQPVATAVPVDSEFILLDGKGRRYTLVSLRIRGLTKGAPQLIVPALERANVEAVFALENRTETDLILKVGTHGVIRGIPMGAAGGEAATAVTPRDTLSTGRLRP